MHQQLMATYLSHLPKDTIHDALPLLNFILLLKGVRRCRLANDEAHYRFKLKMQDLILRFCLADLIHITFIPRRTAQMFRNLSIFQKCKDIVNICDTAFQHDHIGHPVWSFTKRLLEVRSIDVLRQHCQFQEC